LNWQLACVVNVQAPVFGSQQAPSGGGHGFGLQGTFCIQTFGGGQSTRVVTVQLPFVGSQQAPIGGGQRFGLQFVPPPNQV